MALQSVTEVAQLGKSVSMPHHLDNFVGKQRRLAENYLGIFEAKSMEH